MSEDLPMDAGEFLRALYTKAEMIVADIKGDREADGAPPLEYGYECYMDEIPTSFEGTYGQGFIGVVYAGELGAWYFGLTETGDGLEQIWVDREDAALLLPRVFGAKGIYSVYTEHETAPWFYEVP